MSLFEKPFIYSYNRSQQDALFFNFVLVKNSTCFGQTYCPSSGVLILYSQQLVFVMLVMLTAEEIKSRLRSGNACYHSVQNLLSSRLLSKNLKIKIYRTIIFLLFCMSVKLGR